MYTLYHHFLQRVKQQQIQKYNQKHRAYLIRSGKIKNQSINNVGIKAQNNNQNRNRNNNSQQLSTQQNNERNIQPTQNKINDAKPRRQRQFNRPNKNQIKNQQNIINEIQVQAIQQPQIRSNRPRNQSQSRNVDQRPLKSKNQQIRQIKQSNQQVDRPIKQNKLTPQQIEYLNSLNSPPSAQIKPKITQQKTTKVVQQKPIKPLNQAPKKQQQQLEQYQQIKLIQCGICGRKFKEQALQKHENVCQKVFQQKRKKFQVKITDQQAQLLKKKSSSNNQTQDKSQSKKSKWKQQSQIFRNMLQKGRGQKVEAIVQEDQRIQCPGCGRKFAEKAATKHIDFCTKKAKRSKN